MLYFMDATGILAYGRSVHPELIGFNVRPAAIGRYFLEADTVGMRIYRNRRYGFETLGYHQESDTYVMSADREHLLNIAKNFIPPGSSFADLMAPFKPDFNYAASSYFKSGLQVDMPKRRAAIENLLSRVQALGCALHLEN